MGRFRLTAEQQAQIAILELAGHGPSIIARMLGLTLSQIEGTRRLLVRAGQITKRPRAPFRTWTPKETDRLISPIENGTSYATIAKRLKRTETSIRMRCKRIKVRITTTNATMSARDVAAQLGMRCSKTVSQWIRRGWLKAADAGAKRSLWRVTWDDLTTFLENPDHWVAWQPDRIPDLALREWAQELRANEERLLSHTEIANRLGVGRDTIGSWLSKGWLPSVRYGNRRVPASAIDGWIIPIERKIPMNQEWPTSRPIVVGRIGATTFYRYSQHGGVYGD